MSIASETLARSLFEENERCHHPRVSAESPTPSAQHCRPPPGIQHGHVSPASHMCVSLVKSPRSSVVVGYEAGSCKACVEHSLPSG